MASSDSEARHVRDLYARIYDVARQIPPGRVATYGQLAELAGMPRSARVAGYAMRAVTPRLRVPWQRVVGRRSKRIAQVTIADPIGAATQRQRLEREGVRFSDSGGISLADHGWLPVDD